VTVEMQDYCRNGIFTLASLGFAAPEAHLILAAALESF